MLEREVFVALVVAAARGIVTLAAHPPNTGTGGTNPPRTRAPLFSGKLQPAMSGTLGAGALGSSSATGIMRSWLSIQTRRR